MSKWSDFYISRLGDGYADYARVRYSPFIDTLLSKIGYCSIAVEMGCGIGTISKILLREGRDIKCIATDLCMDQLKLTRLNATGIETTVHDIKQPFKHAVDLIHSHGVLEHFSMEEAKKIIAAQLSMSEVVVHYVPGSKYKHPSFGDERLLDLSEWVANLAPTSFSSFNDDHDYILVWEK